MTYKGYIITDGYDEMAVCAETRSKATGVFLARYASSCNWKRLRTKRVHDLDSDVPWVLDTGSFDTVECWGAPVRLP